MDWPTASIGRHPTERERPSSILSASLWMLGLTLALFFLPLINGFIGGFVGGYKVGGLARALAAALLPGVVVALMTWLLLGVLGVPTIGFFAGAGTLMLVLLADLGILLGASVGGTMSEFRIHHRRAF